MTARALRLAARVVLVDARDRVLLLRWTDPSRPDRGAWWITPGGGLDPGEDYAVGALRELFEETGLQLTPGDLGPPLLERDIEPEVDGHRFAQHERFYLARVDAHVVDTSGFTAFEVASVLEHRWWTREELATTTERISPVNLLELLP
jgi:8-oxo-dGTP pyrophosphatase MutT (NUDIX family)